MIVSKEIKGSFYLHNGYPLPLMYDRYQLGFYEHILEVGAKAFDCAFMMHSKVLFSIFTIKYPLGIMYPSGNYEFSMCVKSWMKWLRENGYGPVCVWVREYGDGDQDQDEISKHHYHLALWVNGHQYQSMWSVGCKLEELWHRWLHLDPFVNTGLVHYRTAEHNKICIQRVRMYQQEEFCRAFKNFSYLAKIHSKEKYPPKDKNILGGTEVNRLYNQLLQQWRTFPPVEESEPYLEDEP